MKKYVILIISLLIFIPGLNAVAVDSLDFGEYSEYELIETETVLPTADSTTMNKIYLVDDKYYVTNVSGGGSKKLSEYTIGENLRSTTWTIDSQYITTANFLTCGNNKLEYLTNNTSPDFANITASSTRSFIFRDTSVFNGNIYVIVGGTNKTPLTLPDKDYIITTIDNTCLLFQYINVESANHFYNWQEIYPITIINYLSTDKDMYLFYSFAEISNFNIFSNYNFDSFNDFQKLVIVLGVNTFYLGFIGFIVYIFIKLLNKVLTWIKEFI